MGTNNEKRIIARGLNTPGPLLIVKKKLESTSAEKIRVVVSNEEAALDLQRYFRNRSAEAEIDVAGDDYHVIVDLKHYKDEE
jgi:TusA-related sulfurtransferase